MNPDLTNLNIPRRRVHARDGVVRYDYQVEMKSFAIASGSVSAGHLQAHVDALLGIVRRAVPTPPNACAACGAAPPGAPILVNGIASRLCAACVQALTSAAEQAQAEYDARPTRWVRAIPVGLGVGLLGSLAWAGIAIATNSMFWLLAIVVGAVVGLAAAKGGPLVQVFAAVVTVGSVVLGNILIYAHQVQQAVRAEGGEVDWGAFIRFIPEMLMEGGSDTAFAVGGGLIGAISAVARTGRAKLTVDFT